MNWSDLFSKVYFTKNITGKHHKTL